MQGQLPPPKPNKHCHAEHNLGAESHAFPRGASADVTSFCSAFCMRKTPGHRAGLWLLHVCMGTLAPTLQLILKHPCKEEPNTLSWGLREHASPQRLWVSPCAQTPFSCPSTSVHPPGTHSTNARGALCHIPPPPPWAKLLDHLLSGLLILPAPSPPH